MFSRLQVLLEQVLGPNYTMNGLGRGVPNRATGECLLVWLWSALVTLRLPLPNNSNLA